MRNFESTLGGNLLAEIPHAAPRRREALRETGAHPALAFDYALQVSREVVVIDKQYARRDQYLRALREESMLVEPVQRRSNRDQIEFINRKIQLLGKSELIIDIRSGGSMAQHFLRCVDGYHVVGNRRESNGGLSRSAADVERSPMMGGAGEFGETLDHTLMEERPYFRVPSGDFSVREVIRKCDGPQR